MTCVCQRCTGMLMLSARSLMIDQVAYRLLENAGGAP